MANFKEPVVATVKMKASLNDSGGLAKEDDVVKGYKYLTLNGLKYDCTLAQANTVFNSIFGVIGEAQYDSLSAEKNINVGVDN